MGRTYEKNCPRCTQAQRGCSRTRVRGTYTRACLPLVRCRPHLHACIHTFAYDHPRKIRSITRTHGRCAVTNTSGAKRRTDVHQYNGGRSRRFRNADTQRQAGYVGNPASPPHPTAATPVVLPPTTTPVAPSFHGCEPL